MPVKTPLQIASIRYQFYHFIYSDYDCLNVLERHRANAQIQICKRSSGWCGAEDSLDANWGEQRWRLECRLWQRQAGQERGVCVALPRHRAPRLRALPAEEVRGAAGDTRSRLERHFSARAQRGGGGRKGLCLTDSDGEARRRRGGGEAIA